MVEGLVGASGYVACTLLAWALCSAAARSIPFYRAQLQTLAASRQVNGIDGLRGLLALGVCICHLVIYRDYAATNRWTAPDSHFFAFLGEGCVRYFFIITGYLFWTKALRSGGRLRLRSMLENRARRLLPMYWFATAGVLTAVFAQTGPELRVPASELIASLVRWLAGGALGKPAVNGVRTLTINADVTWTLQYEWWFYLALPLLAPFASLRRFPLLAALYVGAFALTRYTGSIFSFYLAGHFIVGMSIALLLEHVPLARWAERPATSLAALAALVVSAVVPLHAVVELALMAFAFTAISAGNTLFGVLRSPGLAVLGTVSYSVYLLHGLIAHAALRLEAALFEVHATRPFESWCWAAAVTATVVIASLVTYAAVEDPFIRPARATRRERDTAGQRRVRD